MTQKGKIGKAEVWKPLVKFVGVVKICERLSKAELKCGVNNGEV
jgi:hypothetical protein